MVLVSSRERTARVEMDQQPKVANPSSDALKIYNALAKDFDLGSYDEFSTTIADPEKRRKAYDHLSKSYDVGEYADFEKRVLPQSIDQTQVSPRQQWSDEWQKTNEQDLSRIGAPVGEFVQGAGKVFRNPISGLADMGSAAIGAVASPFTMIDMALRKGGYLGERTADAIAMPFQGIAGAVKAGQGLIDSGLNAVDIQSPDNPEAVQSMSRLNQGLAQFVVPGAAKSAIGPRPWINKALEAPPVEYSTPKATKAPTAEQAVESVRGLGESVANGVKRMFSDPDLDFKPPAADAPSVLAMREVIKEMKPFPARAKKMYSEERSIRAGKLSGIFGEPQGEQTFYNAMSAARGELPKPQFDPIRPKLQEWVGDLFDHISRSEEIRPYEKLSAQGALAELLDGKRPPRQYELKLFEKVFGSGLVKDLMGKRPWKEKAWENVMEAINLPRALMASMDMSAPLRQGGILTASHPIVASRAFVDMHKYFFSEKALKALDSDIESRPNSGVYSKSGLYLGERRGEALKLSEREEAFMSHLADRIPIIGRAVKASERAYLGYLNKLRVDVFDMVDREFQKSGYTFEKNPDVYNSLSDFINKATGRGSLGKYGERVAPLLNGMFFAPRNLAARFQLLNPMTYAKMPKPVRVMAMKDMAKFVGVGVALLNMAKLAGAKVETDPRSSDFGKIRIGNTRIDTWGGFQQYARFIAQASTGQRKSTITGKVSNVDKNTFPFTSRLDMVYRFGEQKLSPQAGLVTDALRGETMVGEPFDITREASERLMPLYIQDLYDATSGDNPVTALTGIPAFYGAGVQTYAPQKKKSTNIPPRF
jgi:hypothetical protein